MKFLVWSSAFDSSTAVNSTIVARYRYNTWQCFTDHKLSTDIAKRVVIIVFNSPAAWLHANGFHRLLSNSAEVRHYTGWLAKQALTALLISVSNEHNIMNKLLTSRNNRDFYYF